MPTASAALRGWLYDVGLSPQHFPKNIMPTYHIEMLEGRTVAQKKKLAEEITRVTVEVLGGSPEAVDILITDVKRENWATGGKLWSEPRD
jgi:4-oxalocrotonate tautomerase